MSLVGFNLEAKAQETESGSRSTWTQNENSNQSETENKPTYHQNSTSAGSSQSVATISPIEGTIDVKLKNNTNTTIDYQAIGYTENQTLVFVYLLASYLRYSLLPVPYSLVIKNAQLILHRYLST
jgi:hypothetical protein